MILIYIGTKQCTILSSAPFFRLQDIATAKAWFRQRCVFMHICVLVYMVRIYI